MQRMLLLLTGVLALGACEETSGWNPNYALADRPYYQPDPVTPYARYKVRREAGLTGVAPAPATVPVALPARSFTPLDIAGTQRLQAVQAEARAALASVEARQVKAKTVPVAAVTTVPVAVVAAVPAVPATVAVRGPYPGSTPVLAQYSAQMTHNPGTTVWPRTGANAAQAARACQGFVSADAAQVAFIAAGGPISDPRGLDPDGDGYVCGFDPRPWRRANP